MTEKIKVLHLSDSPFINTGFSSQSLWLMNVLANKNFECHYQAANGYAGQDLPKGCVKLQDGTPFDFSLYGHGREPYSSDLWQPRINDVKPEFFGVLLDTFMLYPKWLQFPNFAPAKYYFWFPSDGGLGLPHSCDQILRKVNLPVAMSKFAQKQALDYYGIKTHYIPHGIDTTLFHPMSDKERAEARARWGLQDKFVVGCFLKGTGVLMNDFEKKKIEDICIGDKVISHYGISRKVLNTQKKEFKGNLFSLTITGLSSSQLIATQEHPILSIKRKEILCKFQSRQKRNFICRMKKYSNCWNCQKYKNTIELKWNPVKNLEVGDYVAFPIPKEIEDLSTINLESLFDIKTINKYSKSCIPLIIPLSYEFLRMIGLFLAECNFIKSRGNLNGINFTFSIKEDIFVEEVKQSIHKIFGLQSNIYRRNNKGSIEIRIMNKLLAHLFKYLCGEYAKYKQIHTLLMKIDPQKQKIILGGLMAGDGWEGINSHCKTTRKTLATISGKLAEQVLIICLRNKIIANTSKQIPKNKKNNVIWKINFHENKRTQVSFFIDDWLMRPIRKVHNKQINDYVYNLEVKTDNSYIVNNVAVHNSVTRNQGKKMLDRQIKSFALFAKDVPEAVMLLHTDPQDGAAVFDMHHLIRKYNMQNRIRFTGLQFFKGFPYQKMNEIYNLMDVFFLSTSGEGFGIPTLEANACGVPAVVTDFTTTHELLMENGQAGLPVKLAGTEHVDQKLSEVQRDILMAEGTITGSWTVERAIMSIKDGARCLSELYKNEELRKEFGRNGIKKVKQIYDWPIIIKQWEDLFKNNLD